MNTRKTLHGIYGKKLFFYRVNDILKHADSSCEYEMICMILPNQNTIRYLYGEKLLYEILQWIADYICQIYKEDLASLAYGYIPDIGFVAFVPRNLPKNEFYFHAFYNIRAELPFHVEVNISYGIYPVTDSTESIDSMLNRALIAIYANLDRKQIVTYYDESTVQSSQKELDIMHLVEKAFEHNQFIPYFQPIYNASSGEMVSAEVLCRLQTSSGKVIYPADFIPMFEKNNMISRLDTTIWHQACAFLKEQREIDAPSVPLSINISRLDFQRLPLSTYLPNLMEEYNLEPSMLHLEVTESAYTNDKDLIRTELAFLRQAGFSIYMDDFGSGYSSLNMLMELPVDVLKIDQKLIQNLDDSQKARRILGSILRMAQWLDLPVVAEGVETASQYYYLRSLGCERIQGYYFSKPLPCDSFKEALYAKKVSVPNLFSLTYKDWDGFEELLSDNPLLFNILTMSGSVAIYAKKGLSFYVIKANDAYYNMFQGATIEKTAFTLDIVHPQDRSTVLALITHCKETGNIEHANYRIRVSRTSNMWVNAQIKFLGHFVDSELFILSYQDITESMNNMEFEYRNTIYTLFKEKYDAIFLLDFSSDTLINVYNKYLSSLSSLSKLSNSKVLCLSALVKRMKRSFIKEEDWQYWEKLHSLDYNTAELAKTADGIFYSKIDIIVNGRLLHSTRRIQKMAHSKDGIYVLCVGYEPA